MIDTLDLEIALVSVQQIYELQTAIKNIFGENDTKHHLHKDEKNSNEHQTVWKTSGFYSYGVLELSVKHKYYPNSTTLKANYKPAIITKKKPPEYSLSDMGDFKSAVDGFNSFVTKLNSELDSFQLPPVIYWDVSRVDYAYQYATPFYKCLICILNKGYAMAKNLGFKDSAYYVNEYRNINFYDKTKKQHLPAINGEHILRFENQSKRKVLKRLAERYRWDRITIYHVWDEKVAKEVIINAIKQLVGKYDFYNLHEAEELVRLRYQTRKAELIIEFLKKTRHHKAKLKNLLSGKIDGYSKDYIRRSIRPALNKICVAPILVPDCYRISILENPIAQILKL